MTENNCYLCGQPVYGEVASVYVPWLEHADRRICVKNIRAKERERMAEAIKALPARQRGQYVWRPEVLALLDEEAQP